MICIYCEEDLLQVTDRAFVCCACGGVSIVPCGRTEPDGAEADPFADWQDESQGEAA